MVMKQSLVYLGNIIPTLYSKQPVFFHCSFGGCDVKKIRSNTLYANTNPPGNKSISHQTGRTGTNHRLKSAGGGMGYGFVPRRVCLAQKGLSFESIETKLVGGFNPSEKY